MKKIPTLFEREFENHRVVGISDKVTPGCEDALNGKAYATVKWDGSCCAIIDGTFYKRYDAKKGKKVPVGAIPCCDPDPITWHWPHWVKVTDDPADKWFVEAYNNSGVLGDGTYEAIGKHFQGNPYHEDKDFLIRHGEMVVRTMDNWTFEKIKTFLANEDVEGLVFWENGEPLCKIKRTDFGLEWPIK